MRRRKLQIFRSCALSLAALLTGLTVGTASSRSCADVALALAVDASSSIDTNEFRFQQQAIASALRDKDVLRTMASAGKVSVAVLFWGDPSKPVQQTEWITIGSASDAEHLARSVESLPRRVWGNTGLSSGLDAALDRLENMGCAHRSVLNVSGDGRGTLLVGRTDRSPRLEEVRARAAASNVTINALVVSGEEPGLADYYESKVITGDGAFVVEIGSFADYAAALRRKLIREIAPLVVGSAE